MKTRIVPIGWRGDGPQGRQSRQGQKRRKRYAWEILADNGKLLATSPPRGYASEPVAREPVAREAMKNLLAAVSLKAVDELFDCLAEADVSFNPKSPIPNPKSKDTASPQRTQRTPRT